MGRDAKRAERIIGLAKDSLYLVIRLSPDDEGTKLADLQDIIGQALEAVESAPFHYRTMAWLRSSNRDLSVVDADRIMRGHISDLVRAGWERHGTYGRTTEFVGVDDDRSDTSLADLERRVSELEAAERDRTDDGY